MAPPLGIVAALVCTVVAVAVVAYQVFTAPTAQAYEPHKSSSSGNFYHYQPQQSIDERPKRRRRQSSKNDCSICCDVLVTNVKTLKCTHSFHENCIMKWYGVQNSCPICRKPIYS